MNCAVVVCHTAKKSTTGYGCTKKVFYVGHGHYKIFEKHIIKIKQSS